MTVADLMSHAAVPAMWMRTWRELGVELLHVAADARAAYARLSPQALRRRFFHFKVDALTRVREAQMILRLAGTRRVSMDLKGFLEDTFLAVERLIQRARVSLTVLLRIMDRRMGAGAEYDSTSRDAALESEENSLSDDSDDL